MAEAPRPELPWAEIDFVTGADNYIIGGAVLAELAGAWADHAHGLGAISKEHAAAIEEASATIDKGHWPGVSAPSFHLHGTMTKVALAMRSGWSELIEGSNDERSTAYVLLGSVLCDLVLFCEAEKQRRYKLGQRRGVL